MDNTKVLEELKNTVAEYLSKEVQDEDLKKLLASVEGLVSACEKLSEKVEALELEKSELVSSVENLESSEEEKVAELSELRVKLEEVEKASKALEEEKAAVSAELEEIKKQERKRERLEELDKDGLLFSGSYREKQANIAYSASDEDFSTYLEDLRAMKEAMAVVTPDETVEPESAATEPEGDTVIAPADIEAGRETASAVPVVPLQEEDLSSKYKEFGETLAKDIRERYNRK